MVEGLESVAGIGMEADTVITCAVEIFQGVDGGLVMLVRRLMAVGGKKCETRGNIWAGACGKPINASHYALVDFGAA